MFIAILIIMGPTKADQVSGREAGDGAVPGPAARTRERTRRASTERRAIRTSRARSARPVRPVRPPLSPAARLAVATGILLVLGAAWALTGYTTSDPALCKDCHWPAAEHANAVEGTDRHVAVSCISCHESGGTVGRYLRNVPARLIHFANTQSSDAVRGEYGRVTVAACSSCHAAALEGLATNEARGLKISHTQPLASSAVCIDCHAMRAGVVGTHNAGMAPCLRCHDSKQASAECATCHDESTASAVRARTTSFTGEQIPDISCGGCHNEAQECDWCHGIRLPHTREFMTYAHARAGAVDFWFNGGATCSRCHTESRRPCQRCHGSLLGGGHGEGTSWLARGHQKADVQACDTCHRKLAYAATRDFCADVCHTPAAIEASPR
jgi:hypothetical protein